VVFFSGLALAAVGAVVFFAAPAKAKRSGGAPAGWFVAVDPVRGSARLTVQF
jgi:hypothetical protein